MALGSDGSGSTVLLELGCVQSFYEVYMLACLTLIDWELFEGRQGRGLLILEVFLCFPESEPRDRD